MKFLTDKTSDPWKCPKCGARSKCGKGVCLSDPGPCEGLLCECEQEDPGDHHGTDRDPCENASCYHCGWGGRLPPIPKKLKPWEKKAIEAGWIPPKGLGL